jgi:hypothetical protein
MSTDCEPPSESAAWPRVYLLMHRIQPRVAEEVSGGESGEELPGTIESTPAALDIDLAD